jgi:electron transfer flavoprotein beta subunit
MKIIVCIKQVPDTTEVRLDPVTGTLIREGVPSIINPDDMRGIEAALQIKEQIPGSTVTIVTMGPPQADIAMREALAMGADEAVLISDKAFSGADTWATAETVAAAVNKLGYDIVITGRQAIDGDTAQVGPQIAERLGMPQISYVEEILEITKSTITVKRQYEDRYHIIEADLPCLITTLSELNKPRYMSVGGVFDAYREKEVKVWTLTDLEAVIDQSNIGLKGSPTKVKKSFTKEAKGKGELFEVDTDEAVQIIVDKLAARYII